ncbi:hypothetical protein ACF0H5_007997 [Mactra antiquata]
MILNCFHRSHLTHALSVCDVYINCYFRKSLEHCKHVLVEFPVSTSAAVTKDLYTLANQKGVVLHEENIALLTPGFLSLKEQITEVKAKIVSGEISLSGSYNGWVEDFNKSGGPFCVNISLIESLYELIGEDIEVTNGKLDINDEGFTAQANLTSSKCSQLSLTVKRTKEKCKREKQMKFILENGQVIEETPYKPPTTSSPQQNNKPGLFMQDFLLYMDEIQGIKPFTYETRRSIRCMELADNIHHLMGLSPN